MKQTKYSYAYYTGVMVGSIIIGLIIWQLRNILPWNDFGFWLGAVLSLVIPFGLWSLGMVYYNWSKNIKQEKQDARLAEESRKVCEKYDSMPFLNNGSESK